MLRLALFCITGLAILLSLDVVARAAALGAGQSFDQVCDVSADAALGTENYPAAIRLHRWIVTAHPANALAHYHLGFAYGMVGRNDLELAEYRKAAQLGLRDWDLYVNLGRAYLESGNYPAATDALWTAVALGPNHAEAHYNLGLAYERRAMLPQAEQEMRTALRLDPDQPETSNMLAVVCVEEGKHAEARQIWLGLSKARPDFTTARVNLAMLDRADRPSAPAPSTAQSTALAYAQPQP